MENTLVEDQRQTKDEVDSYLSSHEHYSGKSIFEGVQDGYNTGLHNRFVSLFVSSICFVRVEP